eukprot:360147-Chlamydomonas_euryale.AAC.9
MPHTLRPHTFLCVSPVAPPTPSSAPHTLRPHTFLCVPPVAPPTPCCGSLPPCAQTPRAGTCAAAAVAAKLPQTQGCRCAWPHTQISGMLTSVHDLHKRKADA